MTAFLPSTLAAPTSAPAWCKLNLGKEKDLSKACVHDMKLWRHGDEDGLDRDDAVGELTKMLKDSHQGCTARAT